MVLTIQESATRMRLVSVKSVKLPYASSDEIHSLFANFRLMCNDAIKIASKTQPRSRFALIKLAYKPLKEYGLHTHYILSACEVAYSAYRNKNRVADPYVKQAFLKVDTHSYLLSHLILRIPTKPRCFVYLILRASDYHLGFIDDPTLKKGEITITEQFVCIPFSKQSTQLDQQGRIGVDINERNVTVAATNGFGKQFEQLAGVPEIKERYRVIRAKIGRISRRDRRISQLLYAKYGRRERNRTIQRLHKVSKEIVDYAKANNLGVVMEKLTGIRKLYRKNNGQGRYYRGRMNSWMFRETQRQVEYKAAWLGVPVLFINPRGTSRSCPDCGSRVVPLQERKLFCAGCEIKWDRDVLASRNIMACVVPQARPPKGSYEGERGDEGSNPSSRWVES